MAETLDQFLDSLSDEELQLLDSDPEFFSEVQAKFSTPSQQPKSFRDKLIEASGKAMDIVTPIRPLVRAGADKLASTLPETGQTDSTLANMAAGAPRAAVEAVGDLANINIGTPQKGTNLLGETVSEALPETGNTRSAALNALIGAPSTLSSIAGETGGDVVSPEAIATAGLIKGAGTVAQPIARLGRTAMRTTRTIGNKILPREKQVKLLINQLERSQGIKLRAPVQKEIARQLGLKPTASVDEIANKILDLRDTGARLPGQLAKDAKGLIGQQVERSSGIRGLLQRILGQPTTVNKAAGVQAENFATRQLNVAAPGREQAAKTLGKIKSVKGKSKIAGGLIAAELARRAIGNTLGGAVTRLIQ